MYDILELSKKLVPELREIAKELQINKSDILKKQDLIYKILDQQAISFSEKKSIQKPAPSESKREKKGPGTVTNSRSPQIQTEQILLQKDFPGTREPRVSTESLPKWDKDRQSKFTTPQG